MEYKNLFYMRNKAIVTLITIFFSFNLYSQKKIESPFTYVFDASLNKINSSELFSGTATYVVISSRTCQGCVEYFTKNKSEFNYIFFINNESLSEIRDITNAYFKEPKKTKIYFYNSLAINSSLSAIDKDMKSPTLLKYKDNIFTFYSYEHLSEVTNEFTKAFKKLKL